MVLTARYPQQQASPQQQQLLQLVALLMQRHLRGDLHCRLTHHPSHHQ